MVSENRSAPRVSDEELKRLRFPQFRPEALAYGPEKLLVCLWCGRTFSENLNRHVSGFHDMPDEIPKIIQATRTERPKFGVADAYREQWGYDRQNPLMSEGERRKRAASHNLKTGSEAFRKAFEGTAERPGIGARFAANRAEMAGKRQAGMGTSRGRMRLESRLRRTGRKLGERPDREAIDRVRKIILLGLNLRDSAKQADLSENKFWRLARIVDPGWGPKVNSERRAIIRDYLFALRRSVCEQPQRVTPDWVSERHTSGLLAGDKHFRDFEPFFIALMSELNEHPWRLLDLAKRKINAPGLLSSGAVVKLTAEVLERFNSDNLKKFEASRHPSLLEAAGAAKQPRASGRKRSRLKLTPVVAAALDSLGLTSRQKEVAVERFGYGRGVREIARKLGIDHKAVIRHLSVIEKKKQKKGVRLG